MMREVLLIESLTGGGVRILGRSDDPEVVQRLAGELAALDRQRLARLEGLRLVSDRESDPEPHRA